MRHKDDKAFMFKFRGSGPVPKCMRRYNILLKTLGKYGAHVIGPNINKYARLRFIVQLF